MGWAVYRHAGVIDGEQFLDMLRSGAWPTFTRTLFTVCASHEEARVSQEVKDHN
jgi:hypothetical protein